jgi:anti-sigma-K factor RskA
MKLLRHDLHTLTGVYALDALDPGAEHDRFTSHLRRCQTCAGEVRGLRVVATSLAFAAAAEPPPAMRERVLAAVGRTRQLSPETHSRSRPGRSGFLVPRLAAAVTIAALVAVAVLAIAQINTDTRLSRARLQNQAIGAILAAPDARMLARRTAVGGVTSVVVSAARRQVVVSTEGLPALRGGKVYQLWLIGPPHTRSAGLLPAATAGHIEPVLATGLRPGDELAMTIEPAGGTSRPTATPVVVVPLPS